ncbi:embigin [Centrocercus urophasianus]|uniref:embigin n=1 Tax=Centrocercus urophasianus TaxID=9002 RepID=UPI001C648E58|nr:embigin [Centrocercus urophasianus]XP_042681899.1 embigin [Centrocercus urophasianus]
MHTGLKSSAEPITTTQTVSQTTWGSIADHLTHARDVSTPGPDLTMVGFDVEINSNKSKPLYVEYEVLLPGESGGPVEKNISLGSPVKIELSCRLADKYSYMKNLQVTWKRGNEIIKHINKTENSWGIRLTISENGQLGSYTCVVTGEEEFSVVFHLQVPQIEGREKPVISYEGDSAILICKSHSYTPIAWTWYMTNGSEQIAINDSLMLDKYVIDRTDANVTHLKILKLTKEDGGAYWCEAAFELGKSKGKLNLKILSFTAPLKPFLAIVAEVVILITLIFVYELYSKKKEKRAEGEKEFDQIEQLKSEESNGVESSSARHRRV